MSERAANDTETPARTALEVYIIDPSSKLPTTPGAPSDGATATKQDEIIAAINGLEITPPVGGATEAEQQAQTAALGTPSDAAWSSGDGTHTALLKTIATEMLDTAPADVQLVPSEYEVVEASQTDQMLGATGAIGDVLESLLVIPTSTTVGAISIEDGSTNTVVYAGGTVGGDLKPFPIPLFGIASVSGGWEITTGAGARVIAFGRFT